MAHEKLSSVAGAVVVVAFLLADGGDTAGSVMENELIAAAVGEMVSIFIFGALIALAVVGAKVAAEA